MYTWAVHYIAGTPKCLQVIEGLNRHIFGLWTTGIWVTDPMMLFDVQRQTYLHFGRVFFVTVLPFNEVKWHGSPDPTLVTWILILFPMLLISGLSHVPLPCESDNRGLVSCWGPFPGPAGPPGGKTVSLDMRQSSFRDTLSSRSSSLSSALSAVKTNVSSSAQDWRHKATPCRSLLNFRKSSAYSHTEKVTRAAVKLVEISLPSLFT